MEFTKSFLKSLSDSGEDICIYSEKISNKLRDYKSKCFKPFSRTSYYFWIKNKRPIPLKVVFKIMNEKKLNKLFINSFSVRGGNRIKISEDRDLRFCYLLGLILGDGCLIHRKRGIKKNTYLIKITFRNLKDAKRIGKLIEKLFELNSSIYLGRGCFDLCIYSKPLVLILNKKYEIPIGKKYGFICVPKLIFNGKNNMKKAFLKGLFESDGNIYLHRGRKCVQLRQKSGSFLEQVRVIAHELNICFRNPYYDKANNSWVLWSSKKQLVDSFISKIIDFKIENYASVTQLDRVRPF